MDIVEEYIEKRQAIDKRKWTEPYKEEVRMKFKQSYKIQTWLRDYIDLEGHNIVMDILEDYLTHYRNS